MSEHPGQSSSYQDTDAYLESIRRTVRQAREMVAQVEARIAETDRFLESLGLTRAQVEAMQIPPETLTAANDELARRGLPPIEAFPEAGASAENASADAVPVTPAERSAKLKQLMRPIRL